MSKTFKTYLLFLGVLLITGFANVKANVISENNDSCFSLSMQIVDRTAHVSEKKNTFEFLEYPFEQHDRSKLFFDIAEVEDIENEESSSQRHVTPSDSYINTHNSAQLLNGLSYLLKKNQNPYKTYVDKSSIKLHVRLQVFII
jgi:hypothetical protein